jgi:hypothetical protein
MGISAEWQGQMGHRPPGQGWSVTRDPAGDGPVLDMKKPTGPVGAAVG